MQDTGYRILDIGSWILDTGYWIQDTRYRIQDTGYRIQDTGFRIQDTGYEIQENISNLFQLKHGLLQYSVFGYKIQYPVSSILYPVSQVSYILQPLSCIHYVTLNVRNFIYQYVLILYPKLYFRIMINFVRIILDYIVPAKPLFSKERRDTTRPIASFRTDQLQARSEQGEKRSNPSQQEFQDGFAPGKVGATREKIKPVLPIVSGPISSWQCQRKERRDPTRPIKSFRTDQLQARSEKGEK